MIELKGNTLYTIKGSYIACQREGNKIYVVNMSGNLGLSIIVSFLCDDDKIMFSPEKLGFHYQKEYHEICLFDKFGFIIRGKGGIRCKYYKRSDCFYFKGGNFDAPINFETEGKLFINDYKNSAYVWISAQKGNACFEKIGEDKADFQELYINVSSDEDNDYEAKFICTQELGNFSYPKNDITFDKALKNVTEDYGEWRSKFKNTSEDCLYALWGNIVSQNGILPTESSFAGNGGMWALWSWDNAYTALALAGKFDQLAYDLFMLPFRKLTDKGFMFDSITDVAVDYRFTKPPVHAIVYSLLMEKSSYFCRKDKMSEVVNGLKKNTDYWLVAQGNEPFYTHGNDSGADDSTCFDKYRWITTAELYALLSEQCLIISKMCKTLGEDKESARYDKLSSELVAKIDDFIVDNEFAVKSMSNGEMVKSRSLLNLRQIVCGDRLGKRAKEIIQRELPAFETQSGFASEATDSPNYNGYGYWRGAVWAPDQLLFNYGLNKMGMKEYAKKMAERYANAVFKTGPYENINGDNGEGHRCPIFSMVAGVASYFSDIYGFEVDNGNNRKG